MNKGNRKVLISIRLSTLILIILAIIIIAVVGIPIYKRISESTHRLVAATDENENIGLTNEEIELAMENVSDTNNRQALISSRSLSERDTIRVPEVEEEEEEETQEEPVPLTTPIEEVKISKDMDLTIRTGVSREDFIILMAGVKPDTSNFFEENAGIIYDVCEKYQLNEIFFCGLISAESGWTIESNHRRTHNYISLMSGGKLIKFASLEDGLEKAAQTLHDNYLTPGARFYHGSTLAGMKTRFCPASSTWVNLVYQRMEQILK